MKKYLLVLGLLAAAYLPAQQSFKMSLSEAIDYALEHQPAYRNYKIDQQIASAKGLEATSKYLPKLNGTVDFRDNLKLGQIALKFPNPVTGTEQDLKITQGTKYSGTAAVDLTQPLLDMGAISDIKVSKQQQQLAALQLQQATIDLKINVSRAYYLVLLNAERVKKAEKSVERYQKAYDDMKVKYDNQNALKSDLNRSYLNLSNAKYQLQTARDSVTSSKAGLCQVIGLPIEGSLELSDLLPAQITAPSLPEYPDFKSAEQNRVELKAENAQMLLNKTQLNKINYQYIPSLNGYGYIGGQGLDNDNLFKKDKWFWTSYIGIRLTVPIFDGLQKVALANQQKLQVSKNENNIETLRNNINYQLKTSAINYANAANSVDLIRQNVQLAEEVVADVTVRFKNSMATYQDVLDAETTLKETEFNYLQAMYAYLIAELDWKKANGTL